MNNPHVVQAPELKPGYCLTCHGITGPFIDTGASLPQGAVYLCARCIDGMAGLLGYMNPEAQREARSRLEELQGRVAILSEQLAHERENKLVPISELVRALNQEDARKLTELAKAT